MITCHVCVRVCGGGSPLPPYHPLVPLPILGFSSFLPVSSLLIFPAPLEQKKISIRSQSCKHAKCPLRRPMHHAPCIMFLFFVHRGWPAACVMHRASYFFLFVHRGWAGGMRHAPCIVFFSFTAAGRRHAPCTDTASEFSRSGGRHGVCESAWATRRLRRYPCCGTESANPCATHGDSGRW